MNESHKQCVGCHQKRVTDSPGPKDPDPIVQKKVHVEATQKWRQHDSLQTQPPLSTAEQELEKEITALRALIQDLENHAPK